MKVKIKLLDSWFSELEKEYGAKITGIYEQGSHVWGFADENSDRDFIVIWEGEYPNKKQREKSLVKLGGIPHDFKDIPSVNKSVDMFVLEEDLLNVAHVKENDFFNFYEQLSDLKSHYKEQLLRIGGFVNGDIHYDPKGKLENYRSKISLTEEIVQDVKKKIKGELEYNLRLLKIANKRKSTFRFIHLVDYILESLHIYYYMNKGKWVISEKWFGEFAKKYGWEDEFVKLHNDLQKGLSMKVSTGKLLKIAKSWGFKPSKKLKA